MALADATLLELEKQERICTDLDDPEVVRTAKKVAFYDAMIDAAEDDPLEPPSDHAEMLRILNDNLSRYRAAYQNAVNNCL